jgi:hypothetical protein
VVTIESVRSTSPQSGVRSAAVGSKSRYSASVKSFGRRQAYESRRGTNPRASGDGYGDFDFRLGEREQRSDLCCAIGGVDGPP